MRAWTIPGRAEYSVPQSVSARWHARHMKCVRRYLERVSGDDRGMATVPKPATSPWGRAIDGLCANAANRACFWAAPLVDRKSAHHRNDPTWGRCNSGTCRPVLHAPRIMQIGSTIACCLVDRFHETDRIRRMELKHTQTSSSYVHCQASGATTAHPLQKRARSYCAMIVQREERA